MSSAVGPQSEPTPPARRRGRLALGALASVGATALALSAPRAAEAYVCTPTDRDNPILSQVWRQTCIPYAISTESSLLSTAEAKAVVRASFDRWQSESCTAIEFVDVGTTPQTAQFEPDKPGSNLNVITSVETQDGLRALMQSGAIADARLVAVTLTRYSPITGEIVDADIILNAVGFEHETVSDPSACRMRRENVHDLENTLVHEIGHLIGFDHVADGEATMFAMAENCETKKRDLGDDDRAGICAVYPAGGPITTCSPPSVGYDPPEVDARAFRGQCGRFEGEPGGCSCAATATGTARDREAGLLGGGLLLAFAALGLLLGRRG